MGIPEHLHSVFRTYKDGNGFIPADKVDAAKKELERKLGNHWGWQARRLAEQSELSESPSELSLSMASAACVGLLCAAYLFRRCFRARQNPRDSFGFESDSR